MTTTLLQVREGKKIYIFEALTMFVLKTYWKT